MRFPSRVTDDVTDLTRYIARRFFDVQGALCAECDDVIFMRVLRIGPVWSHREIEGTIVALLFEQAQELGFGHDLTPVYRFHH
jgi:hypothetical protein